MCEIGLKDEIHIWNRPTYIPNSPSFCSWRVLQRCLKPNCGERKTAKFALRLYMSVLYEVLYLTLCILAVVYHSSESVPVVDPCQECVDNEIRAVYEAVLGGKNTNDVIVNSYITVEILQYVCLYSMPL